MSTINEALVNSLFYSKLEYDGLFEALRESQEYKEEDKKILVEAKKAIQDEYYESSVKVLECMEKNTNLIRLKGNWYGIRYASAMCNNLAVAPLIEKDLYMIERDGKRIRDLRESDLSSLVEGCVDKAQEESYNLKVKDRMRQQLKEYLGITVEETPVSIGLGDNVIVSNHAGMRYCQRKLDVPNETKATDFYRNNKKTIDSTIISSFLEAKMIWEEIDGSQYSFDKDNMMYVASESCGTITIITLYQEDFGWDADQNRWLVLNQVNNLKNAREVLNSATSEIGSELEANNEELKKLSSDMKLLESKIELLIAKKSTIEHKNLELNKSIEVYRKEYDKHFNKLFKKWEGR